VTNPLTIGEALFVLCVFGGIGLAAVGIAIGAWITAKAEEIRQGIRRDRSQV